MQIELIDTYLDLCETRSFNRTAERMGVTQSTVSGRIRALEDSLGRRLFLRSRAGTELTTEGLRFEPHARALRHGWSEALNATRDAGLGVMTMRVGIQNDLLGSHFPRIIAEFRDAMPMTAFFFEADYSAQMCNDLVTGQQDIAVLYSPRQHPDLYFETLGELDYVMVSTETDQIAQVRPETYILANYSPAFSSVHSALHPALTNVSLSIGQTAAMVGMLRSLGGSGYVLRSAVASAEGARIVTDAPVISQTVFAGVNMRQRHRAAYRRMMQILRAQFTPNSARPTKRSAPSGTAVRT